ncbi:MAG: DUF6291 domain-containing protein [Spirochaetales bacterium]|jgi:hypothetical protein|nr:DUF6291 domain-containing protein [Spirochaetales bacterium]
MTLLSSFIFCETTFKQINDLPENLRLKFYEAVTNYGIYNIEPHFTGLENTIWISMKDIIDTTKAKRKVKQKAGKAGGEAKRDKAENKRAKQTVAEDSNPYQDVASGSTAKQTVAEDSNPYQALPNGNGNVNDNGNGNENDNDNGADSHFSDFLKSDISSDPHPPDRLPQQTSPPGLINSDAPAVWEIIRKAWNGHNCRFTCDKIYFNLSCDQRERVRGSMATYTADQMVRAIGKYFEERKAKPDGYEYKSFYLFVEKGMEFYVEA